MNSLIRVGIIGRGSFGNFISSLLPKPLTAIAIDPKLTNDNLSTIDEILACDAIVLAIPLSAYDSILAKLSGRLSSDALIIDVCSVKQLPEEKFEKFLPGHPNTLMTHPLFGPQSAAQSTKGHNLIVTKSVGAKAQTVLEHCKNDFGLNISYMTAVQHDQIMAQVHALTFFIARSLKDMGLPESTFKTPSYSMIEGLIDIDKGHSEELFKTIEAGNKFSKDIRSKFLAVAQAVDKSIDQLSSSS